MPSTREIRRRIRSVKNISQVTRAMQMVAASKMRRAQEQVLATRPYSEKAWEILTHLAAQRGVDETIHPLLQAREEMKLIFKKSERSVRTLKPPEKRKRKLS